MVRIKQDQESIYLKPAISLTYIFFEFFRRGLLNDSRNSQRNRGGRSY